MKSWFGLVQSGRHSKKLRNLFYKTQRKITSFANTYALATMRRKKYIMIKKYVDTSYLRLHY